MKKILVFNSIMSILLLGLVSGCTKNKVNPEDTYKIMETKENTENCDQYKKYFFEGLKAAKTYDNFVIVYAKDHPDAVYLKRYLPPEKEKYEVKKELSDNKSVVVAYNIIPKEKSIREGRKVDFELVVDNVSSYFKLREVEGGTEIYECIQNNPSKLQESMIIKFSK